MRLDQARAFPPSLLRWLHRDAHKQLERRDGREEAVELRVGDHSEDWRESSRGSVFGSHEKGRRTMAWIRTERVRLVEPTVLHRLSDGPQLVREVRGDLTVVQPVVEELELGGNPGELVGNLGL